MTRKISLEEKYIVENPGRAVLSPGVSEEIVKFKQTGKLTLYVLLFLSEQYFEKRQLCLSTPFSQ